MARGWGKDEEDREEPESAPAPRDTLSDDARRRQAERQRRIQLLEQQRERILSERTSNKARRTALQAALEQVEAELAAFKSR